MDLSKSGKHVLLLESCLASSLKELEVLNSEQSSLTMNKADLEAAKAEVQTRADDLVEQLAQSKVSCPLPTYRNRDYQIDLSLDDTS